jgi:hypothetical protein
MDNELFDTSALIAGFPIWTLVDGNRRHLGMPKMIALMELDEAGKFVPLFKDFGLAKVFREKMHLKGVGIIAVATPKALSAILRSFSNEPTPAGIDVTIIRDQTEPGKFYAIQRVLEAMRLDPATK